MIDSVRIHREHIENLPDDYLDRTTSTSLVLDKVLDGLIDHTSSWLTVGDMHGSEAAYLKKHYQWGIASDVSDRFLKLAFDQDLVWGYCVVDAENIEYSDRSFDYVLCKLSLHHMAKPYQAIYEMIRVAREAVIIIEPIDPLSISPGLLWLKRYAPWLMRKLWKNRVSYEPVGNYIFKVSDREIEKLCLAQGLPAPTFKTVRINKHTHLVIKIEL